MFIYSKVISGRPSVSSDALFTHWRCVAKFALDLPRALLKAAPAAFWPDDPSIAPAWQESKGTEQPNVQPASHFDLGGGRHV